MIVVRIDMTGSGRGIVLVTGGHGFPESPQALVGKHSETRWYVDDSYGDKDRDGETTRPDFYARDASAVKAVKRWLRHLGIDPDAEHVRIDQEREY